MQNVTSLSLQTAGWVRGGLLRGAGWQGTGLRVLGRALWSSARGACGRGWSFSRVLCFEQAVHWCVVFLECNVLLQKTSAPGSVADGCVSVFWSTAFQDSCHGSRLSARFTCTLTALPPDAHPVKLRRGLRLPGVIPNLWELLPLFF